MPIYKYNCGCGYEFKALQREDKKVRCPKCGSSELEKSMASSIIPDSNNLRSLRYPICASCIEQNCDVCK